MPRFSRRANLLKELEAVVQVRTLKAFKARSLHVVHAWFTCVSSIKKSKFLKELEAVVQVSTLESI